MNLFIDTISHPSHFILFDDSRNILDQISWEIQSNESSLMIGVIDTFLKDNKLSYHDLKNIVLVNGPGGFTGVRTSVLVVNTISFITGCHLTAMSYFELFKTYPIIKSSSKRDCFVKKYAQSPVEILSNQDVIDSLYTMNATHVNGYVGFDIQNVEIIEKVDYLSIIQIIELKSDARIEPLYIKKPNIS